MILLQKIDSLECLTQSLSGCYADMFRRASPWSVIAVSCFAVFRLSPRLPCRVAPCFTSEMHCSALSVSRRVWPCLLTCFVLFHPGPPLPCFAAPRSVASHGFPFLAVSRFVETCVSQISATSLIREISFICRLQIKGFPLSAGCR